MNECMVRFVLLVDVIIHDAPFYCILYINENYYLYAKNSLYIKYNYGIPTI